MQGDISPTGTPIGDDLLKRCWAHASAEYDAVKAEVEKFNRSHTDRKRGVAVVPAKGTFRFLHP